MFATRHRQRVTAWFAFFAIMMASLMPTVSRAMAAAATSESRGQVCSMAHHDMAPAAGHHDMSQGSSHHDMSPAATHDASSPDHGALHLDHCPFCLTHAGSFGLPPVPALAVPVAAGPEAHLPTLFQSRHILVAWTSAQPRAPPFVS
jgi:hypothetical protein